MLDITGSSLTEHQLERLPGNYSDYTFDANGLGVSEPLLASQRVVGLRGFGISYDSSVYANRPHLLSGIFEADALGIEEELDDAAQQIGAQNPSEPLAPPQESFREGFLSYIAVPYALKQPPESLVGAMAIIDDEGIHRPGILGSIDLRSQAREYAESLRINEMYYKPEDLYPPKPLIEFYRTVLKLRDYRIQEKILDSMITHASAQVLRAAGILSPTRQRLTVIDGGLVQIDNAEPDLTLQQEQTYAVSA